MKANLLCQTLASSYIQIFIWNLTLVHARLVLSEIKSKKKEELDVQKSEFFWQLKKCSGQVSKDLVVRFVV